MAQEKSSPKSGTDFSKYILNCLPSRNTESDWPMESAEEAGLLAEAAAPPSKDLREAWWKIGDQAATGSCVGWATADSVLRWHFAEAGRLEKADLLSMRFIWMAAKETDVFTSRPTTFIERDGTSLKAALDIARKYGVVPDSTLPFAGGALYGGRTNTFYALAAQRRIASYFNLGKDPADWRRWIAANGPILTALLVDDTWYEATANQGNLDVYKEDTAGGGHAVALVGYTEDRFIVRNSWSASWGDAGFAYASDAYASSAFIEAYGVML